MIKSIRVQNFKSIADVELDFAAVTVLVGLSGTGKSNFIQAIKTLRDCLRNPQSVANTWNAIRPLPKTEEPTSYELRFGVDGIDQEFAYRLLFDSNGPMHGVLEEKLCLGSNVIFHQLRSEGGNVFGGSSSKWLTEPPVVNVPSPGAVVLGNLPSISDAVIAFTAITEGIGCYSFPNSIMLNGERQQHPQSGFDDIGSNYLQTMKQIVSNLQDLSARRKIVESLKRINDGIVSVELDQLQTPQHAIVGHQFQNRTLGLNLDQESEGFRRFFAHLLALYQRPPKLLLLFEHPEDGIHPGAMSLLADEFNAAPVEGRGQVLLTTHSPGLLDNFEADSIRVVQREGFCTKIGPLAEEQRESLIEELLTPGELLTVNLARLQTAGDGAVLK